ncbi:hypothetical protein ACFSW4_15000 [Piscibacillus salipiscarius]|uniref:Uncharacterized protein n=1 Tax=Piscibacillus salipiscarius TaxID=299480 RepID=A0ABW5QED0_9BACI
MEISKYKDKDDYQNSIDLINTEKEIQILFGEFQSLLVSEKQEIIEENFLEKKIINNY